MHLSICSYVDSLLSGVSFIVQYFVIRKKEYFTVHGKLSLKFVLITVPIARFSITLNFLRFRGKMADSLLSFIKEESESEEELLMEVHLPQHSASASEELFHFRYVYYNGRTRS
jgi:hypothetical protein